MAQLPQPNSNRSHSFLRFSSMATQMGITIFLGVWGGIKLDQFFQFKTPVMTLICSLLGVILAVYIVIREVLRKR